MDSILSRTGFGLYSSLLLTFGILCFLTDSLAYMNMPLYLPMISCDAHLHEDTVSAVDFSVYIGMAIGGFFLCAVSDVVGRKAIIATSLLLIFLGVLGFAFAYGPFGFVVSMLIFGAGLETNMNVIKVLFFETLPKNYRYTCIICLDLFWIFGSVFGLGFYWITTPIILEFYQDNQRFLNWRISVLLSVFLAIILACITALFLESPKFLLFDRRPRDALEVIREIYAINKSKLFTTFEIADGELQEKIMDFGISQERDIPNTLTVRRIRIIFSRMHKSLLVLVRKQFLQHTLLAIIFRLLLSVGHLPMMMLWSRCLNLDRLDLYTDKYLLWHFEHPVFVDCGKFANERDLEHYRDFVILCTCALVGTATLMFLARWMRRRLIMTATLFLSGVFSALLSVTINHYGLRFAITGLLAMSYNIACSCLDLIILDMFPTAVRSTAMGETMIFARVVNIFVIKYMVVSIQWLFIVFACLMEFGAVLACFLPKFTNKTIVD